MRKFALLAIPFALLPVVALADFSGQDAAGCSSTCTDTVSNTLIGVQSWNGDGTQPEAIGTTVWVGGHAGTFGDNPTYYVYYRAIQVDVGTLEGWQADGSGNSYGSGNTFTVWGGPYTLDCSGTYEMEIAIVEGNAGPGGLPTTYSFTSPAVPPADGCGGGGGGGTDPSIGAVTGTLASWAGDNVPPLAGLTVLMGAAQFAVNFVGKRALGIA